MNMNQSQQEELSQDSVNYCYWHPDVETGLSCSQCAKSVCINCMVQAPVGIRCRECGKSVKMPTYDIQRGYYARAVGVGAGVAIGGGLMWALVNFVNFNFIGLPYFASLIGVAIGYGAGELISRSVNRKRGTGLAWIAGFSVVGAFWVSWRLALFLGLPSFGPLVLLFVGFGVYTAVKRVR